MPPKRMTANPLKPARHRPGKPLAEEASESSEDSSEEEEEAPSKPAPPKASSFPKAAHQTIDLASRRRDVAAQQAAEALARQKLEAEFETESEESSSEEGSESGNGEESSEEDEESSSEEEAPRRKLLRPVFLKKNQRPSAASANQKSEEDVQAEEEARRRAAADALVQEQLELAAAAKAAGKKNWDDEDNIGDADAIDDTDDIDPEAEYAAWKLRELMRIRRERAAIEAAEAERAEIERRRNLTAAEREAEDREFLEKQKEERGDKGNMAYMQKYFHKGAFFQEDLKEQGLDRRDIMGSRFADDVTNRELLPEYMQIRDMSRLGKKGRTKYKDLKSEDTGRWGDFGDRRGPRGDGYPRDIDERFRPDRPGGIEGATGANAGPLGERKRAGDAGGREGKRARVDEH